MTIFWHAANKMLHLPEVFQTSRSLASVNRHMLLPPIDSIMYNSTEFSIKYFIIVDFVCNIVIWRKEDVGWRKLESQKSEKLPASSILLDFVSYASKNWTCCLPPVGRRVWRKFLLRKVRSLRRGPVVGVAKSTAARKKFVRIFSLLTRAIAWDLSVERLSLRLSVLNRNPTFFFPDLFAF